MKIKHRYSHYFLFIICVCLVQQPGYGNVAAKTNSNTPGPYFSTGFPQIVVVSGTNYEMGMQYGEQTAPAIIHNLTIFKSMLYKTIEGGEKTVTADMQAWNYYLVRHDPTLKDWLDGMVQGCANMGNTVSYNDLVLLMVYPSELWSRPTNAYPPGIKISSRKTDTLDRTKPSKKAYHSCNSFAATGSATSDGNPIHAITQMANTEMMDNVILIAFPRTGHSFVSQTYAGRVNANSAMNSNGLAWTMTAIPTETSVWGLTEVYFHYLAQVASSRTEAVKYLQDTPRGGVAGGFILSDANGIEVFETHADNYARRSLSGESGFLAQTNHLVDPGMASHNPPWVTHMGTIERYDTVFQHLSEAPPGAINFDFTKMLFSSDDWYDKAAGTWHRNVPGSPFSSNSHGSVSESIFCPADLTAYLATGTPSGNGIPAYATGEYVKIRLSTDPEKVIDQADADTLNYYWAAADLFEKEMNTSPTPSYLTSALITIVRGHLDSAMTAYSIGIDRAAFAYLEKTAKKKNALRSSALSGFAKAQLYAQMAMTSLKRAGAENAAAKEETKSFFRKKGL